MARSAEQRSFIRHFHDSAKVHNSDTAGDMFDYRQIVRDKDVGQSKALLQVAKQVNDLCLHRNVKCRDGLVTND